MSFKGQSFLAVRLFSIWIQTCSSLCNNKFPYLAIKFTGRTTDFRRKCCLLPTIMWTLFDYPANVSCRLRVGCVHCYSWGLTDRADYAPRTEQFLFCTSRMELISHARVKVSFSVLCPQITLRNDTTVQQHRASFSLFLPSLYLFIFLLFIPLCPSYFFSACVSLFASLLSLLFFISYWAFFFASSL
jgi:hypothetical protein